MPFSPRPFAVVLVLALAGGLAACSDTGSSGSLPTPSPTPAPDVALAALARSGLAESYTATYTLRSSRGNGTLVVQHTPTSYRLDVTIKGRPPAILVRNSSGTFACQRRHRKTTCFKVAAAGKAVPAVANAGQQVFSDYLAALEKHPTDYTIAVTKGTPALGTVPAGTCFTVKPAAKKAPAVAAGMYCLSATGIPTKAAFASGNFDLRRLDAPPTARLVPPARATPFPGTVKKKVKAHAKKR